MTLLILAQQSVWIPGVGESSSRPIFLFFFFLLLISAFFKLVNVCQTGATPLLQVHTDTFS